MQTISRKQFLLGGVKAALLITAGGVVKPLEAIAFSSKKVVLRYGIFSDGHYGQPGTHFDQYHQEVIKTLNQENERNKLDFVIINGDLFHDDALVVPSLVQHLRQLEMHWYPSHGNHDRVSEAGWKEAFGHPFQFAFEKGESAFVFLNTADEKGTYIPSDKQFAEEQFRKYARKKHLFVVMHITPFSWTEAGFAQPELVPLFSKQKNLKAVFHGHDHEEDSFKFFEDKPYFFDGHAGGSWGVPYHGYRVVEVLDDDSILLYQKDIKDNRVVHKHTV